MMQAAAGTTFVRIEKRFGLDEARRLREALEALRPIRQVSIDFSGAEHVEDAALSELARLMVVSPECRFRLAGLTHHKRRLLRYMGAPADAPARDAAA